MRGRLLGMLFLAGVGASVAAQSSAAEITISAEGAVANPGVATYPAESRLSTVSSAAAVQQQAYVLGAAWLRPSLERDQLRQRAGLVFELSAIRLKAARAGNNELADTAERLRAWVAAMPVTGRRVSSDLDPAALEITPSINWPVENGDRLFYPARPEGIRVVGAVGEACHLPLMPLQDARRYLRACPVTSAAEPSAIYVIQPDGTVFMQNVALWNRDPPRSLAPGAWIYVPLDERAIAGAADEGFNKDFADFLGTQLLSDDGWR